MDALENPVPEPKAEILCDLDVEEVPPDVQKRIDQMSQEKRDALVGAHLRKEEPDIFGRVLVQAAKCCEEEPQLSPLKPQNSKSKVWQHFRYYTGTPDVVYCNICCPDTVPESQWNHRGKLKRCASKSTKSMRTHLKKCHEIELQDSVEADSPQKMQPKGLEVNSDFQKKCHEAMVKGACFRSLLPLRLWEAEDMRHVLNLLSPGLQAPSRKTCKKVALAVIQEEMTKRREFIAEHFTERIPMLSQEGGVKGFLFKTKPFYIQNLL